MSPQKNHDVEFALADEEGLEFQMPVQDCYHLMQKLGRPQP